MKKTNICLVLIVLTTLYCVSASECGCPDPIVGTQHKNHIEGDKNCMTNWFDKGLCEGHYRYVSETETSHWICEPYINDNEITGCKGNVECSYPPEPKITIIKPPGYTQGELKLANEEVEFTHKDSTDIDGAINSYDWEFTEKPEGSQVQPIVENPGEHSEKWYFIPDVEGTYKLKLTVRDEENCPKSIVQEILADFQPDIYGNIKNIETDKPQDKIKLEILKRFEVSDYPGNYKFQDIGSGIHNLIINDQNGKIVYHQGSELNYIDGEKLDPTNIGKWSKTIELQNSDKEVNLEINHRPTISPMPNKIAFILSPPLPLNHKLQGMKIDWLETKATPDQLKDLKLKPFSIKIMKMRYMLKILGYFNQLRFNVYDLDIEGKDIKVQWIDMPIFHKISEFRSSHERIALLFPDSQKHIGKFKTNLKAYDTKELESKDNFATVYILKVDVTSIRLFQNGKQVSKIKNQDEITAEVDLKVQGLEGNKISDFFQPPFKGSVQLIDNKGSKIMDLYTTADSFTSDTIKMKSERADSVHFSSDIEKLRIKYLFWPSLNRDFKVEGRPSSNIYESTIGVDKEVTKATGAAITGDNPVDENNTIYIINGIIDMNQTNITIINLIPFESADLYPELPEPGNWKLAFYNKTKIIEEIPFDPCFALPNCTGLIPFFWTMIYNQSINRVVLYNESNFIKEINATPNTPTLEELLLTKRNGGTYELNWTGTDLDDGNLTYIITNSNDGENWTLLNISLNNSDSIIIDTNILPSGKNKIRIIVSDDFNAGFFDTVAFTVENKPPECTILTPGIPTEYGEMFDLEAVSNFEFDFTSLVTDLEDAEVLSQDISWFSPSLGISENGKNIKRSIWPGLHVIELTAIDSEGLSCQDVVYLSIYEPICPSANCGRGETWSDCPQDCPHEADTNEDGFVNNQELLSFLDDWTFDAATLQNVREALTIRP